MSLPQFAFLSPPLPYLRHHSHPRRRHIAPRFPSPRLFPIVNPRPQMSAAPTPNPSDLSSPRFSSPPATTSGFSLSDLPHFQFQLLTPNLPLFQHPGAYCIRDDASKILYMGYSKDIASKLTLHQQNVPSLCHSFQVYIPTATKQAPLTAEMLESVLEFWVRENGGVPEGNTVARDQWEGGKEQRKRANASPKTSPESKSQPNVPPTASGSASTSSSEPAPTSPSSEIPIRERSTEPRRSTRRYRADSDQVDPFADNFRSATGATPRRRRKSKPSPGGWAGGVGLGGNPDDDYVEVDADPLDPFSASKKQRGPGGGPWDFQFEEEEGDDDWMPIVALMGCAGLIWLFGLLSNALPAATPSLGM